MIGLTSFRIWEAEEELMRNERLAILTHDHIKAAENVLSKGDRVELIPVKDGVKVIRVRREEIKIELDKSKR